jgi:putative spermidine/putrescine transport system substrate-binding protein
MLGQLRTQKTDPQLDVVIMDTTTAAIACAEGLVEPLTPAMLPVLDQIDAQARGAGGKCGPGVTFDHLVVVYDSKAVSPAPTSVKAMWDPRWKGRVGMDAPPNILGLGLTAILAHAATGDWTKADPAFEELRALAPSVQTFQPQPDPYALILNGTLTFAIGWNARGQLYHDRSQGRLGVMLPSEGTIFQINTINLVRGAPHRDEALKVIAYALSAPAQKAFTERMFYAPTNTTAQIDPAAAERTAAAPDNKARVIPIDWTEMLKLRDSWNQRWRREVISASSR